MSIVETIKIDKQLIVAEDMEIGVGEVSQTRSRGQRTYKKVNATTFGGPLVVSTLEEMEKLKVEHLVLPCVVVIETGQVYNYDKISGKWNSPQASVHVQTVEELKDVNPIVKIVNVADATRGGLFIYDEKLKQVNDGGLVFSGWKRVYQGEVNVKWFGALGNGSADDTEAMQTAIRVAKNIYVPPGNYKITSTIVLGDRCQIRGTAGSIIETTDRITVFKLGQHSCLISLDIHGRREVGSQVGVLIDGEASLEETSNTKVVNCNFKWLGTCAYRIRNTLAHGHEVVGCSFSGCEIGIDIDAKGWGLGITSCSFERCAVGIRVRGTHSRASNLYFNANDTAISFITGGEGIDATSQSFTEFLSCVFSKNTKDLTVDNCPLLDVHFASCSFERELYFNRCSNFRFSSCCLNGATVRVVDSNNLYFIHCPTRSIKRDEQNSSVFWLNCYDQADYVSMPLEVPKLNQIEGGSVYVTLTQPQQVQGNSAKILVFNNLIENTVFGKESSDIKFYDKASGTFDFLTYRTPKSQFVDACIKVTINSSQVLAVYLYKVENVADQINYNNLDLRQIELSLTANVVGSGMFFTYVGRVLRGLYKLVLVNRTGENRNLIVEGEKFDTSRIGAFSARFTGI